MSNKWYEKWKKNCDEYKKVKNGKNKEGVAVTNHMETMRRLHDYLGEFPISTIGTAALVFFCFSLCDKSEPKAKALLGFIVGLEVMNDEVLSSNGHELLGLSNDEAELLSVRYLDILKRYSWDEDEK